MSHRQFRVTDNIVSDGIPTFKDMYYQNIYYQYIYLQVEILSLHGMHASSSGMGKMSKNMSTLTWKDSSLYLQFSIDYFSINRTTKPIILHIIN